MAIDGLFSSAEAKSRTRRPLSLYPNCARCGLSESGCHTPKMAPAGGGRRRVLFVGDYPGQKEDEAGRPFVGGAADYVRDVTHALGFDLDRDAVATNAQICRAAGKEAKTATEDCRPNLLRLLARYEPTVIVTLGAAALESVVGHAWGRAPGPLNRWTGRCIPSQKPNAWILPCDSPAFVLRPDTCRTIRAQFERSLATAVSLADSRPWPDGPPDYAAAVRVVSSPDAAAAWLSRVKSGTIAFDYETTCLKPEPGWHQIVCCSVCWNGAETVAFPWAAGPAEQMRRILADPAVGKIASNLDMEARHSRKVFGFDVANWRWDTMLAAHCLDPRPGGKEKDDGTSSGSGTTGLKYQAFVRLGFPEYNSHLEEYLRSKEPGGNAPNRIREVPFRSLALYCGLDSLLEYLVAEDQAEEMETEL